MFLGRFSPVIFLLKSTDFLLDVYSDQFCLLYISLANILYIYIYIYKALASYVYPGLHAGGKGRRTGIYTPFAHACNFNPARVKIGYFRKRPRTYLIYVL